MAKKPSRPRTKDSSALPPVTIIEVDALDSDGELKGRPPSWDKDSPPPDILIVDGGRRGFALRRGDRVLARLSQVGEGAYEARPMHKLDWPPSHIFGVYEVGPEGGRLKPTSKKARKDFVLNKKDSGGAEPGELVRAQVLPSARGPRLGLRAVKVLERLGPVDDPRGFSLIAIHEHEIPFEFPEEAVQDAEAAGPCQLKGREDLRDLPLVTIDGADARDFDDAVFAEPDSDPENPGGWHLLVAIADVAHYVRPDSSLDQEAQRRGNSVYFPDRVVPMLPEALSNEWCSLKPREERATLAVHLWIDAQGHKLRHRFVRGLMRSHARLTYDQVESRRKTLAAGKAKPEDLDRRIKALYGAYEALERAHRQRGALELDLPERKVLLNDRGEVQSIGEQPRLASHCLIEEFMIAANVAAAEELEHLRLPCMYRVHDAPDPAKLEALRQVLESLELSLPKGQVIKSKSLNSLLAKVKGQPAAPLVNMMILRSQSQAAYAPGNLGHFGLALRRYAHFTSPIRRYADLLVHRALIQGLKFGKGGWTADDPSEFGALGEAISRCERRAVAAEREVVDRFTAAFLADRVGETFSARVSGLTRAGLFVTLVESGGDGLIPLSFLQDDRYDFDPAQMTLEGRRWGRVYRLGTTLQVRLVEATPVTGGLILEPLPGQEEDDAPPLARRGKVAKKQRKGKYKGSKPPRAGKRRR